MMMLTTAVAAIAMVGAPQAEFEKDLLPVGSTLPEFVVPTPSGEKLKFSEVFKANKATLINFWFYH